MIEFQPALSPPKLSHAPDAQLGREERTQLQQLRARDREVRAHEQSHRTAAGDLAHGATQYEYETGPDGVRYAVGGEVQIDTSPAGDPRSTIAKAERIIAAALAPAQPSAQDRAVAAKAAAMAAEARAELARQSETPTGEPGSPRVIASSPFNPKPPNPGAILLDLAV